jgi:G3E family GTPase
MNPNVEDDDEEAYSRSNSSSDDDDEAPILVELHSPFDDSPRQQSAPSIEAPPPPCPVTILSGFLGAGKTTLIQYILQSPDHGKRIAIIENEFGGGGDDGGAPLSVESLIARDGLRPENESSLQNLIELPNGCVCCTVKDSLVVALENLLDRRSDLDYILIECSGMANPGPIAALFWLDDALHSRLKLDGIVTLIDAANIHRQLHQTMEASQQIAYADRILLNKVDLVADGANGVDHLLRLIRRINLTAPIQQTRYASVPDLTWILDAKCFDLERAQNTSIALLGEHHDHESESNNSCEVCCSHQHTAAVSTITLTTPESLRLNMIHQWMAALLWPNQDERDQVLRALVESNDETLARQQHRPEDNDEQQQIYRIKGVVSIRHDLTLVDDDDAFFCDADGVDRRQYIVQVVHDLWEIHPSTTLQWNDDGDKVRYSKLVVIGRNLNETELRTGFDECQSGV